MVYLSYVGMSLIWQKVFIKHEVYNCVSSYGQNLKIIHFIGAAKPWLQQYNFESSTVDAPEHIRGFLQLWWDIFVSLVHPQLDTAMVSL